MAGCGECSGKEEELQSGGAVEKMAEEIGYGGFGDCSREEMTVSGDLGQHGLRTGEVGCRKN
jgi:hypothetical protein